MSLTMADGVETARGSQGQNSLLRKQLALAVKSVQWSYAVFWSSSSTQSGVLEWGEGCYNGDIRKRKKRCEAHYKYGLHRSKQLRKLYLSMLEGDIPTTTTTTTTTISTAHHDHYDHNDDDDDDDCNTRLSPDDLSDEEWYYLVSMSYVFSPSQCLPGRALAMGETIWLCNAQYAENKFFSRSLLARSASIQYYFNLRTRQKFYSKAAFYRHFRRMGAQSQGCWKREIGEAEKDQMCSRCKEIGHVCITCPYPILHKINPFAGRRIRRCSRCHWLGHNVRTCLGAV